MRSPREEAGLGAAALMLNVATFYHPQCWGLLLVWGSELIGDSPKSSLHRFLSHSQT